MTKRLQSLAAALAVIAGLGLTPVSADHVYVGSEAQVAGEDIANLRSEPGIFSRIITLIFPGRYLYVLDGPRVGNDGSWYRVEFDGDFGWVRGDLLRPAAPRDAALAPAASAPLPAGVRVGSEASVITDGGLNLRAAASTGAPVMEVVRDAAFVYVIDGPVRAEGLSWVKVEYDGAYGWVSAGFLGPADRSGGARPRAMSTPISVADPGLGGRIAQTALKYVGLDYAWGGRSPATGFDCSGLVAYVLAQHGIHAGRTADEQAGAGVSVKRQNLLPGDIVVFANTSGAGYTHNGIYVGNGKFVHAKDWDTGVVISSVFEAYWSRHYAGARRPW
ncbi:MAG: NlpC/P60 family protein [Chloroflexi bacterium]|nr:NlpC/P60 family protein [Chloroflexota bacterium]